MSRVWKIYVRDTERVSALRGVDLSLHGGEIVALLGPSGSGKTTVLNLCAGWEVPDRGRILWHSSNVALSALPWDAIAVVPQDLGLLEELSMSENVKLPATVSGYSNGDVDRRIGELFLNLRIDGLERRIPSEVSRGQQQRASLARALFRRPELLLADEPTAHQDAGSALSVFEQLSQAADAGTCCVLATHDEELARKAHRVVRLHQGEVRRA